MHKWNAEIFIANKSLLGVTYEAMDFREIRRICSESLCFFERGRLGRLDRVVFEMKLLQDDELQDLWMQRILSSRRIRRHKTPCFALNDKARRKNGISNEMRLDSGH